MSQKASNSIRGYTIYDASRPLPSIYQKRAAKELSEDASQVSAHLESFKRWLKSMHHLKINPDDDMLIAFLRHSKYNHQKAQVRLDKFCTFRTNPTVGCPEWFINTQQRRKNWEKWLEMKCWTPLGFTPDGVMVGLFKWFNLDFNQISMEDLQCSFQLWTDFCLVDPRIQIGGLCMIMDFTGFKKENLKFMIDQRISKGGTKYFQECLPFRISKLVYFNVPKIFEAIFKVYREWLNEKIRSRLMTLSGDLTPAFEEVPGLKDLVPQSFGGNNKLTFEEICEQNFAVLKSIPVVGERFGISVDETKRPKECRYSFGDYKDIPSDIMGKSGTYVKLNDDF